MYNKAVYCDSKTPLIGGEMEIENAGIFARGNIWYMQYQVFFENGTVKQVQTSTKVKVSEKSRNYMLSKYLPAKLAQIIEQSKTVQVESVKFGYFHKKFIELKRKNGHITFDKTETRARLAIEYFGKDRDVRKISRLDIKEYISFISAKGRHRDTIKGYLYMLSGILELAVDAEIIQKNPAQGIKVDVKSPINREARKPFTKEEAAKLIKHSSGDLKNYLGIAFSTGMSPEELIALMPSDLNFENRTIKIQRVITHGVLRQETKTQYRTREIPMFDSALPFIENQLLIAKSRRSMFLFSKESGERLDDITDLRGQKKNNTKWYGLLNDCDIEYRPLKNTRHTFAVEALKSGKFTPQEVADILGHSNLRMLINHYADYINGSAKGVNRCINLYGFTDTFTDSYKIC